MSSDPNPDEQGAVGEDGARWARRPALAALRSMVDGIRCRYPLASMLFLSPWSGLAALAAIVLGIRLGDPGLVHDSGSWDLNASTLLVFLLTLFVGALVVRSRTQGTRLSVQQAYRSVGLQVSLVAFVVVLHFLSAVGSSQYFSREAVHDQVCLDMLPEDIRTSPPPVFALTVNGFASLNCSSSAPQRLPADDVPFGQVAQPPSFDVTAQVAHRSEQQAVQWRRARARERGHLTSLPPFSWWVWGLLLTVAYVSMVTTVAFTARAVSEPTNDAPAHKAAAIAILFGSQSLAMWIGNPAVGLVITVLVAAFCSLYGARKGPDVLRNGTIYTQTAILLTACVVPWYLLGITLVYFRSAPTGVTHNALLILISTLALGTLPFATRLRTHDSTAP